MDNNNNIILPVVGLGVTYACWTDRHPAFITWVSPSGKTIRVRDALWKAAEGHAYTGQQKYDITPDPVDAGHDKTFRLCPDGRWKSKGYRASLGQATKYEDPSF